MAEGTPLSPQDRAKVFAVLQAADPTLADRVALLLDDREDPMVRLLTGYQSEASKAQRDAGSQVALALNEMRTQVQRLSLVVVVVSVIAMCLNAALVGVGITMQTQWGGFTTQAAGAGKGGEDTPAPRAGTSELP